MTPGLVAFGVLWCMAIGGWLTYRRGFSSLVFLTVLNSVVWVMSHTNPELFPGITQMGRNGLGVVCFIYAICAVITFERGPEQPPL